MIPVNAEVERNLRNAAWQQPKRCYFVQSPKQVQEDKNRCFMRMILILIKLIHDENLASG